MGGLTMKRLVFAIGVLALGLMATVPARADFAIVKFPSGYCRIWTNTAVVSLSGTAHPQSRLVVPISAVVRTPDNPQGFGVFRIEEKNGKAFALTQPVQIGETYGNTIEVTSGVAKGDRIIALGGELVRNEQEIRVVQ
jgi:hypothetical protein